MERQTQNFTKWALWLLCLPLAGCGGSGSAPTPALPTVSIQGAAQKGPFVINSTVLVNHLSALGQPSADTIVTRTTDGIGNFRFETTKTGPVQLSVEGYHYNEISGTVSDGPLTLRGIYDVSSQGSQTAYVNVLTHLINNRVLKLLAAGASVTGAITQAQQELLATLSTILPPAQIEKFAGLSVFTVPGTDSNGNAYLLALSATVYQYAKIASTANGSTVTGELTLLLNRITSDLEDNGTIDAADILIGLKTANSRVDTAAVVANLANLSASITGTALSTPNIAAYFDRVTVTAPANGTTVLGPTTIRFVNSVTALSVTYQLLVDGSVAATLAQPATEFEWNPYFWSTGSHTLLIRKSTPNGSFIDSNLVTVTVSPAVVGVLQPLAPANQGFLVSGSNASLSWTGVQGAASYDLQVGKDSAFSNLVTAQTLNATTLSLGPLVSAAYYWRFRATTSSGRSGAWSSVNSFGIDVFSRTYNNGEYLQSVLQTLDGGYVTLGATESGGDITLRKTDVSGQEVWFRRYDGPAIDSGRTFIQTSDGGFIIAGSTDSSGSSASDAYVVKVDSLGAVQFTKTLGDTHRNMANGIADTGDGYLLTVYSYEPGNPYKLNELIKLDLAGNESWRKTLFSGQPEFGYIGPIRGTSDGGFVISGYYDPTLPGSSNSGGAYLAHVDSLGNLDWESHFTSAVESILGGVDVMQTMDGGYLLVGQDRMGADTILIKTNTSGAKLWLKRLSNLYVNAGGSRALAKSGTDVIVAVTNQPRPVLVSIAADGNVNWQREYPGNGSRSASAVYSTSDGGFILAGSARIGTQQNAFLIKTNAQGESLVP